MFKHILKKINVIKSFMGRYVPAPVKTEYKAMKGGIKTLKDNFNDNYFRANLRAKLQGKTSISATADGLKSAIAQTQITKNEIPSLFALAGCCSFPYPGTTEAGYAIGRILTSKPALKIYNTGKQAILGTYSTVSSALRI